MKVISNTAITLDGRISPTRDRFSAPGSRTDHRMMSRLRNQVDAILIGGNTFRATPIPLVPNAADLEEAPRPLPMWNVIVSASFDLPRPERWLHDPRIRRLILTAGREAAEEDEVEIVSYPGAPPIPLPWIIETLEARGIHQLLVEGGGQLVYQFLRDGLLDELYLTLCPKILGVRGAPSLADGPCPLGSPYRSLHLCSADVIGDEIFLLYRRPDRLPLSAE